MKRVINSFMSFLFTWYLLRSPHDFSWMISTWDPSTNEWKPKLTDENGYLFCHKNNYVNVMKNEEDEKKAHEMLLKLEQTSMYARDIATMPSKKWKAVKIGMTSRLLCFLFFSPPKSQTKCKINFSVPDFYLVQSVNFRMFALSQFSRFTSDWTSEQTQRVLWTRRWIHISM